MSTILLSYWRHNLVNSVCLNVRGFLSVCQSHAVLPWSLQAIVFSSIFVSWRIFLINPHTFGQALVTWRTENNIALEMQKKKKNPGFQQTIIFLTKYFVKQFFQNWQNNTLSDRPPPPPFNTVVSWTFQTSGGICGAILRSFNIPVRLLPTFTNDPTYVFSKSYTNLVASSGIIVFKCANPILRRLLDIYAEITDNRLI